MIDKLIYKIADWHNRIMIGKGIINNKNYSDKDYAFRCNLQNIISFIIPFIMGIVFNCTGEMLAIFIVFNILRVQANGYHSYNNFTYCLIISILLYFGTAMFSKYYTGNLLFILATIFGLYSVFKAPVLNDKYEELEKEISEYKVIYSIFFVSFFALSIFVPKNISNGMLCGIIIVAPFLNSFIIKTLTRLRKVIFGE